MLTICTNILMNLQMFLEINLFDYDKNVPTF